MPFYSDTESYYANMRTLFACVQENYPKATEHHREVEDQHPHPYDWSRLG